MKCPKCNGRKYIELDKIGLLVTDCPECEGTGEEAVLTEEMLQQAIDIGSPTPMTQEDLEAHNQDEYIPPEAVESIELECPECEGTGEIEETESISDEMAEANAFAKALMPLIEPPTETNYIGIVFQLNGLRTDMYSDDELWMMTKQEAARKELWPHIVVMPCGNERRFYNFLNLPVEDIPCPCGNPNHYIVKFIDNREALNDNPKYLILPELIPGKTIEETADVAREIIKASKGNDDSNSGTGQNNSVQRVGYIDEGVTLEGTKPSLKKGEYFCTICISAHRETSKKGKKHLKYKAGNSPLHYKRGIN